MIGIVAQRKSYASRCTMHTDIDGYAGVQTALTGVHRKRKARAVGRGRYVVE